MMVKAGSGHFRLVAIIGLLVFGMLIVSRVGAEAASYLIFDMQDQGRTIENKFSVLNSWFYDPTWRSDAAEQPEDYMASNFPFVETVQLMTATGGVDWRDLFNDPYNRNVWWDYNFEKLKDAIRQVLRQGLKPYIKTGNVPEKYSSPPVIGVEFGANLRPPDDYEIYYRYIKALAEDLVKEFGIDEVKTWMWGVLTEYENKAWFDAGTPEETKIAYFKLYDYTVAALEDVLGPENVIVGAHSMSVLEGYWDEREFIEHVARGVNHRTGAVGTQIDFLAVSFYDRTLRGLDHAKLIETVSLVREKAEEVGLAGLRYGVDEGRILQGWDSKPLVSAALNLSAQGAADAKLFKVLVDHDIDWFALWSLSTGGTWGGANAIGSNIANLTYRMVGDTRIGGEVVCRSEHTHVDIDGLASYDAETQTLRLLVYNVQRDPFSRIDDEVIMEIRNIAAVDGGTVTLELWRVDDDHANWWPAWEADERERGLTDSDYNNWSKYSVEIPEVLRNPADQEFWRTREPVYYELSQLRSTVLKVSIQDGILEISDYLPGHGVAFYEIRGVVPAQKKAVTN
ncbi:MAG TPA: hypothetical protein GXX57_04045 [Firmicutes bacterium]|nr:hypothetical protein [Bacillota bacterium]